MTEAERTQSNRAIAQRIQREQHLASLQRQLAGAERERQTFNAQSQLERLQRETDQVLRRERTLTETIDRYRRQIAMTQSEIDGLQPA